VENFPKKHSLAKCKELHAFIHALTLGQHLGVRQQLPPKRLKMYDAYRSTKKHDPEAIRAIFPEDTRQNLSSTKRVLLDQITRYVYLHTPHDGIRDLELLIGEGKALLTAGQGNLALEKTEAAIKGATKMEAMDELLKAVRLYRRIQEALRDRPAGGFDCAALEASALAAIAERQPIDALFSEASALKSAPITTQYHAAEGLAMRLEAVPFPVAVRNQIKYRLIRFFVARISLDAAASLTEATEIVRVIDAQPDLLHDLDLRDDYFTKMNFIIAELSDQGALKEAEARLHKLKAVSIRLYDGVEGNPTQYARYLFAELYLKMAQNEWDIVRTLVKQLNKEVLVQDVLKGVATRLSILRMGALAAFLIREFKLARRFILSIRADRGDYATKTTLLTWAGIMYLLTYVEEKDPYLKTALKDISTWFKLVGCDGPFERALMAFFKEVSEDSDNLASASSLTRLQQSLTKVFEDPAHTMYTEILKIEEWIQCKQRGVEYKSLLF
jgi:hypothetical protein